MRQRRHHMRPQLKPVADVDDQAPPDDQRDTVTHPIQPTALPLSTFVQGVIGADGRWWVSIQPQQGSLALAFALPPEDVADWFATTGRDARAMAAKLREQNGATARKSGLIVPGNRDVSRFTPRNG